MPSPEEDSDRDPDGESVEDRAVHVVMDRRHLSEAAARQVLLTASSRSQRRLHDLAQDVAAIDRRAG
jgi:hypothetical protein